MNCQKTNDSLQHIRVMCTEKMSFDTKIFTSLLSNSKLPKLLEASILFVEYCQLASQSLLFNKYFTTTSGSTNSHFNELFTNIAPVAKLFSPGQFFEFTNSSNLAVFAFGLIISYLVFKYLLITGLILIVLKRIRVFNIFMSVCKWFFRLHGRLLFYLSTSFLVEIALAASQEKFDPFEIGHIPLFIIVLMLIIIEYLFSMFVYIHYAYVLPNKSFLGAKDTRQQIINLSQKFLMQILVISLPADSIIGSLIFTSTNLLLSMIALVSFFRYLPLYKLKALFLEGSLLVGVASINIVFFLQSIIITITGRDFLMDAVILLILILIPPLIKANMIYLNRKVFSLITEDRNELPEVLIHKINIVKHFRKKQKPFTDYSKHIGFPHLIHTSYNACAKIVFHIDSEPVTADFNNKDSANKIFLAYLENLSVRFPKNDLIKLYLAYYLGAKFRGYGVAIKILFGLQQHSSSKIGLNASVLINEIQKKLKTEYQNSKGIDLSAYIHNMAEVTDIKQKILDQAELQIKICQEFNENSPNLANIFDYAQKVSFQRCHLENRMNEAFETLPEYNLEPQILAARYHLVLNHSILDYLEHVKAFTKKYQLNSKHLAENHLCKENIYQKENGFMMVTTEGGNTGTITYCSRSVENIFGANLLGNYAYSVVPSFLQNYFFDFFRNPLDAKHTSYFGNIVRTFGYHQSGYLIEMDFYMNIHPFISQGLYYDVIIHPIQPTRDYLMVSENGTIEAYTKDIGDKLGLFSTKGSMLKKSIHVEDISRELGRINNGYNKIYLKDKRKPSLRKQIQSDNEQDEANEFIAEENELSINNIEMHEAEAICEIFNSEGRPLILNCLKHAHTRITFTYQCKIKTQFYDSHFVKIIILEKAEVDNENIEKAKNVIWKASEKLHRPSKQRLTQKKTSTGKRKSECLHLEKTLTVPTFHKPEGDSFDHFLDSYPVNLTDKQSCDLSDVQIDHLNYSKLLQRSKSQFSEEDPVSSNTKHSLGPEINLEDQRPKLTSSKAENSTPIQVMKIEEAFDNKWEQEEKNAVEKLEIVQNSLGSQKSKSSAQGRVSKALKEAMAINYYPNYYNVFIPIFYFLFVAVFICMLSLKLTFDGDIRSRQEEKDVIRTSERRNDLLTSIQRDLRNLQDLSTGRLTIQDLGLTGKSELEYIDSIDASLLFLATLNNKLLLASRGLGEEFRQRLFERNVRVFETDFDDSVQKFIDLNNFQATDRIVESGFKGLNLAKTDMTAASPYFEFMFRNGLNDFLIKCDEISDIFIKALDSQEENTLQSLEWIMLSTSVIIFIIIIISGLVVARQCDTEKKYMLAFIKLNHLKVREILSGLVRFKQVIEEDNTFDEVSNTEFSKFLRTSQKAEVNSKKIKQVRMQNFDLRGTFKKYLQYWINLIFLMSVVACFLVLNYLIARDTISTLHLQLHQIQFSDRISARLNLAVVVTQEMLLKGNTTLIRNLPAPKQVELRMEDVKIMRKELSYMFDTKEDVAYDSIVEKIVFQDVCPYLSGIPALVCEVTKQGTDHASLLHVASQLEIGITSRRDAYASSNKSYEIMREVQVNTRDITVYPNLVLNYGTTVISEMIEKVYERKIADAKTQSSLIWAATCIMMILVAVFAWFWLLRKVRGADGKFKKVLQTLPPNLILSNFVLKSYLLETSQGTLDFVKNEI